jgi:hypothetical protein
MAEDDLSHATQRGVLLVCALGLGVGFVASCRGFQLDSRRDDPDGAAGAVADPDRVPNGEGTTNGGAPVVGGAPNTSGTGAAGMPSVSGGDTSSLAGAPGGASDGGRAGLGGAGALAGAAGQPAGGGAADELGANEPVLQPSCKLYDIVGANGPVGLALSLTSAATGVTLFTWDRPTSTALVRWSSDLTPRNWTPWVCFDLVPEVSHLAAFNLPDGYEEVLALSRTGHLFVRAELGPWGSWLPLSLPSRAMTTLDLAAVGGAQPRVYVLGEGRAYFRSKVSEEPYAAYGPWRSLAPRSARALAALRTSDGRHRVFVVADTGAVAMAEQPVGSEFGAWQALPSLGVDVVDLVATEPAAGALTLHALGANGALHSLTGVGASSWHATSAAALGAKVTSLASRAHGQELQLFAIDGAGVTYRFDSGQWVKTI